MFLLTLLLAVLVSATSAEVCPPAEEMLPCVCQESGRVVCQTPMPVKEFFDNLTSFVTEDYIIPELYLTETGEEEFQSDMISAIKFKGLTLEHNFQLRYIHPDAFSGSFDTATGLYFGNNEYLWRNSTSEDIFSLARNFKKLESLTVQMNTINTIPENGIGSNPELKDLRLIGRFNFLGSRLFSEMPKLGRLTLQGADLSLFDLADDVFEGIAKGVIADLMGNNFLVMPEKIFKPLLDQASEVHIGGTTCIPWGECYDKLFECNSQVDWICQNVTEYQPKLFGYMCFSERLGDIWGYCEDKFGNL